jgi:hypothetical protein
LISSSCIKFTDFITVIYLGEFVLAVVVALPSYIKVPIACVSCSATATQSFAQSLPKFQIIFWHLIFGNDCRKLGGVVKEGQG